MNSAVPSLLKKFETAHRVLASAIKSKPQKEALAQLLEEGRVVHAGAYYLAGQEPTVETECRRIVQILLSRPRLFKQSSLKPKFKENQPFFRSALSELVDRKEVIQLAVVAEKGMECFIHRQHLASFFVSAGVPGSKYLDSNRTGLEFGKSLTSQIRRAYDQVAREKARSSIFISDLLKASGLTWEELRAWIEQEVVQAGQGQLDEGDWAAATDEQRAASVEFSSRKRLYIALP